MDRIVGFGDLGKSGVCYTSEKSAVAYIIFTKIHRTCNYMQY